MNTQTTLKHLASSPARRAAAAAASLVIAGAALATSVAESSHGTAQAVLAAVGDPLRFPFPYGSTEYLVSHGDFAVTGVYGANAGQPAPVTTFQGTETFEVRDAGNDLGSVTALVSHGQAPGLENLQVLVVGSSPAEGVAVGTGPGELSGVGSVFNWGGTDGVTGTPSGDNVYTSLADGGHQSVDDLPVTGPSTTGNVVSSGGLAGWFDSFGFDGTSHVDVHTALVDPTDFTLPNGDYVVAVGTDGAPLLPEELTHLYAGASEQYDAITNTAPYATAVQGTQLFEIVKPDDTVVGTFIGRTISTADLAGGHSFEILPLGGQTLADGTAAADDDLGSGADQLPTTGSVFNILYYFSPRNYGVYTDYNGTGPGGANEINGSLDVFGFHFGTTWGQTFDAVKGFTDGTNLFDAIPYADGSLIHPTAGSEIFTGINGIPNGGLSGTNTVVQGIKEFTWQDADGTSGTFNADVTTFGNSNITDVTVYLNPQQFDYTSGEITALSGADGITYDGIHYASTDDVFHTVFANGNTVDGGTLPSGLAAGSEIELSDHGWYETMTVNTDPLDSGDVAHMVDIFGWGWSDVPTGSEWIYALLFDFPSL